MVEQVRKATYAEVIGYWFNYEYESRQDFRRAVDQRFGSQVLALRRRDYDNPEANVVRREIMYLWRGPVLQGLDQAEWSQWNYDDTDLASIRLIDSGDWRDITSGSLNPMDATKRIESDQSLRVGPYASQVNFVLHGVEALATRPTRIVLAGIREGPFTVVDGVHRIVAACLYYKVRRNSVMGRKEAYVGLMLGPYILKFA